MLCYSELKPGTVFVLDSQPYQVLEARFSRMQQRKPVMQTKIKNILTGKIISRNFQPSDQFEEAEIEYRKAKFIYQHRGKFVFSEKDNPSARFELDEDLIGENKKFFKPEIELEAVIFKDKITNIHLPIKMNFKVVEAPPGVQGDRATSGTKPVKIETGATVNVPLFIKAGDVIKINTQTGEYVERVKS